MVKPPCEDVVAATAARNSFGRIAGAPVSVIHRKRAGLGREPGARCNRRADGEARVAGGGMNVDFFETAWRRRFFRLATQLKATPPARQTAFTLVFAASFFQHAR